MWKVFLLQKIAAGESYNIYIKTIMNIKFKLPYSYFGVYSSSHISSTRPDTYLVTVCYGQNTTYACITIYS